MANMKYPAVLIRLGLLFTSLLLVAIYWAGLKGGFFFDDAANILDVEALQIDKLSVESLHQAWDSGVAGPAGRPIAQLSFALNYYFSGFNPFAFKATNLAIHLINGFLVYLIARRLVATPLLALIACALWLLQPIQLTSVLYVVQRMTSLSTLFVLTGFASHLMGRTRTGVRAWLWLGLAWLVCWPLAFLSKETGAIFPLFIVAWELIVRRREVGYLDKPARLLASIVGFGLVTGLVISISPAGKWLWAGYELRSFTLVERILTEGRVLWFYLSLIVFPRLGAFSLFHDDILVSTSLFSPWTTLLSWVGVIGLVWGAWRMRNQAPLLSFGIAWFLIGHCLESTVLPLEIAHEHRNYLPSFGVILVEVCALGNLLGRPEWRKVLGLSLALALVGYYALITELRAQLYGNEVRRTQLEAEFHPMSARTQYEAGRELLIYAVPDSARSPQYFFIRKHYQTALKIAPDEKDAWLGLIQLNCMVHIPVERQWIYILSRLLKETPFAPGDRNLLYNIKDMSIAGTLCLQRKDVEGLFSATLDNKTVSPFVESLLYSWLADYLTLVVHDLPAAQSALGKSLLIAPWNSSNRLKQVQLAFLLGQPDMARKALHELKEADLKNSEKNTVSLMKSCLNNAEERTECTEAWKQLGQ